MPPKKPAPVRAPVKPVAKAPVKPAGRGAPAARGAPAGRGGPVKKGVTVTPPAKKGTPAPKAAPPKPKEKVWTKDDDAARKIQTKFRQYRAKQRLAKKKKEKEEYDELMDKLEKEAFVKLVKMEQEEAEKQRLAEEEKRRKKREEKERKKRMLEAAFDGDVDIMSDILKEHEKCLVVPDNEVIARSLRTKHKMAIIECEDANENTAISEAASGGNMESIKFLLDHGAEPNTIGQFMRTPLYRAAFAGHLEACEILLQNGADPRIYASDGQMPKDIASLAAIVELIENWDMEQTDVLLSKLEAAKDRRREEEQLRREAEQTKMEEVLVEAQLDYDTKQKQLNYAYTELNKRIYEHDAAPAMGFEKPEITIQAIHDQETDVEILKIDLEKSRDKLANARLKLREQKKGDRELSAEDELPGLKVTIRELDDVLLRDVGNRIADSCKWPLLIDTHSQAVTFLRYRDTNYINALNPKDMEAEIVRMAVLGSVRFGKPCVIDMMEVDMFHAIKIKFDVVCDGLLDMMMDKSIMQEENYMKLIKENDPPDYQKNKFNELRTSNFKVYLVTKNPFPPEELLDMTYPIRVHVPVADS